MSVKLRSKKLTDGSESLYLDLYLNGIRKYEFLKIKIKKNDPQRKQKKEIAEAKRSKRELEVLANYHEIPNSFNGDEDFLEYYENNSKDKAFLCSLKKFKEFLKSKNINGKLPFKMLSKKIIEDYVEYIEKEVANSTAWVYLLKLKTVLNKAVKDEKISRSPAKYVKVKLNDIEKIYLTEDELKKLASTDFKDIEVKKAFLFSCFTGLRISDIVKLTWGQIKDKNKLHFIQKKTKGVEYLPLSESAIKYLYMNVIEEKIKPDERVFGLSNRHHTINKNLKKWIKKAEIDKHITFHSGRHTFATLALSCGIDIFTVSKMLGHKSIKTTEIYAKIINKTMEDAIKRLPII